MIGQSYNTYQWAQWTYELFMASWHVALVLVIAVATVLVIIAILFGIRLLLIGWQNVNANERRDRDQRESMAAARAVVVKQSGFAQGGGPDYDRSDR